MHRLHEMLEEIEDAMYSQMSKGIECVDTDEFGKAADIYKDLMNAKKNYYKAEYYESVVEAMEDGDKTKMPKWNEDMEISEHDYESMAREDMLRWFDTMSDKSRMMLPKMSAEDRSMVRSKLMSLVNSI